MKKKLSKALSILLAIIMTMSLIQLPSFAEDTAYVFRDTAVGTKENKAHRYWMSPYGDELTHYDYYASDGASYTALIGSVANNTNDYVTIDTDGVMSMTSAFPTKGNKIINIQATTSDGSTTTGNFNPAGYISSTVYDSPFIHDFDVEPYALSNGLIYDRNDLTSTVVFENADVSSDASGNNYMVQAEGTDYIGFRPHYATSTADGAGTAVMNSTIMQFDVYLSSSQPFSISFNSSSYPIFQWNNETNQIVESPYAAKPYTTFTPPASVEPGWHNVKIMFEFRKKAAANPNPHRATYQRGAIFFDDELLTEAFELPALNLYSATNSTRVIRFEGSDGIDNFKYYGSSTPHAYGVELDAEPICGSVVGGYASMYSLGNFTNSETHFEYSYYVSESTDSSGSYTKITSTDSAEPLYITDEGKLFINNNDYTGHFIKVGAQVSNRGGLSPEIMSKEAYEIQEYVEEILEPYIIYDAETATAPIARIYDRYYETKRAIVEVGGRKGVPWGPSDAGIWKADATIADPRGEAGDLANRPGNITVIDASGNTKIPMADYQYLVIEMYSANNTNQPFLWRLYEGSTGGKFYTAGFNANWEGEWKTIRLAIAGGLDDCGEFRTSSTPACLPYQAKMMQLLANTSSAIYPDTEVYIGKIYLEGNREEKTVANENGEYILPDRYDPATMTDYVSMVKTNHPNKSHPRLLVSDEILDRIIEHKDTDDFMGKAYAAVKAEADAILNEAVASATYTQNGAMAFSRNVEDVAKYCGLMYLLTGNEAYAARVWAEAEVMINCEELWYDTSTGLDAGHIANGMALLYDWCYDYLSDSQKLSIRNALMRNAFAYAQRIRDGAGYMGFRNNVVAANSKGFMTAALAICDESGYEDFCNEFINNVVTYLPQNLGYQFVPDGSYAEGPGYWKYAVYSLMFMTDAMLTSIGSDGGLQEMEGLDVTGYYPFAIRGTNSFFNLFNYSDANKNLVQHLSGVYHYLSEKYDIPALRADRIANLAKWTRTQYPRPTYSSLELYAIEDLLWYNPEHVYDTEYSADWSASLPKDYFLDGLEPIVSMRSGYSNTDNYIGAKGGNSKTGHDQYDAGTFVLDALGQRWIHDMGADVYGGASPDNYYYRIRTEGHNCIVFDPESGGEDGFGQTVAKNHYETKCPIVDSASTDSAAFSVIDLQPSYQGTVNSYKRGFALTNNRTQFVVQDEFETKEAFEMYSYFHISQDAEIVSSDGQSLILEQNGKYCKVNFVTDISSFEIGVMDAVHHPSSPQADSSATDVSVTGYDNSDYKKIYFRADNVEDATITVVFTPMSSQSASVVLPEIKPLANWN